MKSNQALSNQALYQQLFESSQDPMWMIVEDQFVVANESAARFLGYSSVEELTHHHPSKLSPEFQPDGSPSYDKANEMMAIAFRDGYHRFEWVHQKHNGENLPVEVTLTRVSYEGQQGLFCVWRDMSDQKRAQQALAKSHQELADSRELLEQKVTERTAELTNEVKERERAQRALNQFKTTLDLTIDCVFILDPASLKFTYVNHGASQQLGYSAEELVQMGPLDINPKFNSDSLHQILNSIIEDPSHLKCFETEHLHKDGHLIPVEIILQYVKLEGEAAHFIAIVRDITERRHAEMDLHRTQFAVEHAGDAIYWVTADASFISVNNQACSNLDYSREELLAMKVHDIDPEFPAEIWPQFWSQLKQQSAMHAESLHKRKDGHEFPVELSLSFFEFAGGEYALAVAHDITERKRAEKKLKQTNQKLIRNEMRLKEAQKIAHIGHWELNIVTNELQWSEEVFRIFEIDAAQFSASYEAFLDLIHPDDRELVNLSYSESLRTQQPYDLVHRLLMPDGRIKYVREMCHTDFNEQGKPLLSIGTVQDITEKERLRLRLAEEEEKYHSLVSNIPAIVYRGALDKKWTMHYLSSFTEDLTGYPVSDFLYNRVRSYASIIHPDDRAHVENSVNDALDTSGRYFIEYRIIDSKDNIHWVFEKGQVVHTHKGEVDFLDGFIMDISERKHVELMLQEQKEMVEAIHAMQSRFILQPDPFHICRDLLEDFKKLTHSEYGFVSEVYHTPEGEPYMTAYAIDMLAWNKETRELYKEAQKKGFEFHKLDNLFGHVITDREVVMTNDPQHDARSAGLPKGHPAINNFLGIPVFYGEKLVGVIGLANRKGGYNLEVLDYITPLVSAYGQIVVARQAQLAREAAEATLAKLARLDGLLGIPNRRSFDEYLESQWQQAHRNKQPLSLIMIDIDHFKLYNDHYGHQQGDECLIQIAEIIGQCIKRPADLLARYGGEEFVCVLPDTPIEGAMLLAENIRTMAADAGIEHAASLVADHVTLSLGVSTLIPSSPEHSPKQLIEMADQALYQAKSAGRNQAVKSDE